MGSQGGEMIRENCHYLAQCLAGREKNRSSGVWEAYVPLPALPIIGMLTFLKLSSLICKMEKQFIELSEN